MNKSKAMKQAAAKHGIKYVDAKASRKGGIPLPSFADKELHRYAALAGLPCGNLAERHEALHALHFKFRRVDQPVKITHIDDVTPELWALLRMTLHVNRAFSYRGVREQLIAMEERDAAFDFIYDRVTPSVVYECIRMLSDEYAARAEDES